MTKNRTPTPVYLDPGMYPGLEVKGLIHLTYKGMKWAFREQNSLMWSTPILYAHGTLHWLIHTIRWRCFKFASSTYIYRQTTLMLKKHAIFKTFNFFPTKSTEPFHHILRWCSWKYGMPFWPFRLLHGRYGLPCGLPWVYASQGTSPEQGVHIQEKSPDPGHCPRCPDVHSGALDQFIRLPQHTNFVCCRYHHAAIKTKYSCHVRPARVTIFERTYYQ